MACLLNLVAFCALSRYLLEKKSDDSILLILIIRIMDDLGNYGNGNESVLFYIYLHGT